MSGSNSLINLGDVAKPANTLIEKISDAIGGIFKPYQIRRVAEAEADADKIRTAAQIEITELQQRAMVRFIAEEAKKQTNIEAITIKALSELSDDAKPEHVEDDWITNFFDKCRLISDEEMQNLWARILAGEANSPGTFSKRTIDLLASLDKTDAALFSKLCSFGFLIGHLFPLVYKVHDKIYSDHEINFETLSHLESIGLIHFNTVITYFRSGASQKGFVHYFDRDVWLQLPKPEDSEINVGHVVLTKTGQQLAPMCGAQAREGFVDYVTEKWRSLGYKTEPEAESSQ